MDNGYLVCATSNTVLYFVHFVQAKLLVTMEFGFGQQKGMSSARLNLALETSWITDALKPVAAESQQVDGVLLRAIHL